MGNLYLFLSGILQNHSITSLVSFHWLILRELILKPFHVFRIGCSAKTFNGWLPSNVFAGWLHLMCVTGTWVPSWSDVILIWYHYIVICMLVIILNWWLSSKDMKLWVLIEQALVVFHWLTFCIILLCSLASEHLCVYSSS